MSRQVDDQNNLERLYATPLMNHKLPVHPVILRILIQTILLLARLFLVPVLFFLFQGFAYLLRKFKLFCLYRLLDE
jgi:hypothetical protein